MSDSYKSFSSDSILEVERLEMALEAAGVGAWELDLKNNTVLWCKRAKALYGFSGDDIVPYEQVISLIHPDDRQKVLDAIQATLIKSNNQDYDLEFRVLNDPDGKSRWLHCKGQAFFDEDGNPSRFLGTAQNVSKEITSKNALRDSESRIRELIEQAPMAIAQLSGPEMTLTIANDNILKVWGRDKSAIGRTLEKVLPEIEEQGFMKLLSDVYKTGIPYTGNGAVAKLNRQDRKEDIYFDFVYNPVRNREGEIEGVMILATEVTAQHLARKAVEASEAKFRSLIEEAPIATCLFVGRDLVIEVANEGMLAFWGKDESVIGHKLKEAIPELEGQPFLQILDEVYLSGETYESRNTPAELPSYGKMGTYYFDFTYKPLRDASGQIYAIMEMATDVTQQVLSQKALKESETKLRTILEAAPAGMVMFSGPDMIVEMPNQAFIDLIGKGPDISGRPIREIMPELESQAFLQILDNVYQTGEKYQSDAALVEIVKHGEMTRNLYDFTYTPLRDSSGEVFGILDVSVDVTEREKVKSELEESELFSRNIIQNSPVAKLVLIGEEMKIRVVNENMLAMLGRTRSIIGEKFMDASPELLQTPLLDRLLHVYRTGKTYYQPEEKIDLIKYGFPYTGYYNYIYAALKNTSGEIYGIAVTATEVTEQVLARQKIEQAEQSLRDAVELAELGTWELDPVNNIGTYSSRMATWTGISKLQTPLEEYFALIDEKDRERIKTNVLKALESGSNGLYFEEYTLKNKETGQERIVQAKGRAFFSKDGTAYVMRGTALDITEQRLIQKALERQVQERTEELEASNEELAAINEEYMATNEELTQSNNLLTQSNQNLQEFAYIASHDLQEPLRKIQSFGNLLSSRYNKDLGDGSHLIERMQNAAGRMSILIQDLLVFSRVSSKQDAFQTISLSTIVEEALSDLEITIQDSGAIVHVGNLPVMKGDESQMRQLFQNLLSNALKFKKDDVTPEISVECKKITYSELPMHVKPVKYAPEYYVIQVSDNGIGFDPQYKNRIFQVFQRLHGKSEFAGTGVGLAICEKVAINHGGEISAEGQPGQGAVFSVYLPV